MAAALLTGTRVAPRDDVPYVEAAPGESRDVFFLDELVRLGDGVTGVGMLLVLEVSLLLFFLLPCFLAF
jgi:hypothetical protein